MDFAGSLPKSRRKESETSALYPAGMWRYAALAAAALLGLSVWAARATTDSQAAGARSIRILETSESGGVVTLRVKITGWKMYPARVGKKPSRDGGHWAIFVDGRRNAISTSATVGRTKALADGTHQVAAVLVNNDDSQLRPPVRSGSRSVRVGASEPPAVTTE